MPRTPRVVVLLAVLASLALALEARAQTAAALDAAPPGIGVLMAPVEIDGGVLFQVRGISAYPAQTRAAEIAARIRGAARDRTFQPGDLRLREVDGTTQILAGDTNLVSVLDADARLEGVSRTELAQAYIIVIRRAIEEYRSARQTDRLLVGAARAALSTVLLVLFVYLVRLALRGLDRVIVRRFRHRIEALEARSFEIVRAERIRGLIRATLRTFRAALLVAGVYYYLQHTLGLFPWTRLVALRLASWIIAPVQAMWHAFVVNIPGLIFLAILAVVVRYGLRALYLFFDGIGRGAIQFEGFDPDWAVPTYKIARIAVIAFALVVAYPYIPGSGSEAFKGVSLFLGVIVSLGSSSVISNMMAGLAITYRRAFKVGDRVKIGAVVGEVTASRLQVTHLRTPKNEEVVMPNSTILNTEVTNYSTLARKDGVILHTTVGIGYEVPWRQVEAMLLMAAERTRAVEKEPPPFVLQRSLGDFAVNYELNAYCRDPGGMWRAYSELHQNVQDVFNEYGVQIMTPSYEADTAQPKVVPKDQWYAAPARPAASSDAGGKTPSE